MANNKEQLKIIYAYEGLLNLLSEPFPHSSEFPKLVEESKKYPDLLNMWNMLEGQYNKIKPNLSSNTIEFKNFIYLIHSYYFLTFKTKYQQKTIDKLNQTIFTLHNRVNHLAKQIEVPLKDDKEEKEEEEEKV